jgi:hypothetical protein
MRNRQNLVQKITFICEMTRDSLKGLDVEVVPAFLVDTVNAKQADPSRIDLALQRAHHTAVFVFKEPAHGRGKNKYGGSGVTEAKELHVPTEAVTVPAMVFAVHVAAG